MNKINYKIIDSPSSNDNQIRFIIDDSDYLSKRLGIDPPSAVRYNNYIENSKVLIGRCECGTVGCDDLEADIIVSEDTVKWIIDNNDVFIFDKEKYLEIFNRLKTDYSWETIKRKLERLIDEKMNKKILNKNYVFTWASTRINRNTISLSFVKSNSDFTEYDQKFVDINWDEKNINDALQSIDRILNERGDIE